MNHQKKRRTQKNHETEDDRKTLANFKQVFGFNDDVLKQIKIAHKYAKIYDNQTQQCAKRKKTMKKMKGGSIKMLSLAAQVVLPRYFKLDGWSLQQFFIALKAIQMAFDRVINKPLDKNSSFWDETTDLITYVLPATITSYIQSTVFFEFTTILSGNQISESERGMLGHLVTSNTTSFYNWAKKGLFDADSKITIEDGAAAAASAAAAAADKTTSVNPDFGKDHLNNTASTTSQNPSYADFMKSASTSKLTGNEEYTKLWKDKQQPMCTMGATDVVNQSKIFSVETVKKLFALATGQTGVIVMTTSVTIFILYYLYTRTLGNLEENIKLDNELFVNHKRRQLILNTHLQKLEKLKKSTENFRALYKKNELKAMEKSGIAPSASGITSSASDEVLGRRPRFVEEGDENWRYTYDIKKKQSENKKINKSKSKSKSKSESESESESEIDHKK